MTKETLMEMGLTEEQAGKVMESLNGDFVPKNRFNEVNRELQSARATLKERDSQLEGLKKTAGDADALKKQIADLQAENARKDKAHAGEIHAMKMENAVQAALTEARAINPATVKPLLTAFLEKAELQEDGTISGLADKIGELVKGENTSFLFRGAASAAVSGASPAGSVTSTPDPKAAGYQSRLDDARKGGNMAAVVAIKREAAADGVTLF